MSRPKDPHLDPLRAPTRRGQHPHTLRSQDEVKNPQHMYERRDTLGAYHAQTQALAAPQPQGEQKSILENPLVMVGIGAALVYGIAKLLEDSEAPRKNPAPAPAPASAPVFVMPSAIPVSTTGAGGPSIQAAPALPAAQGAPKAKPKRKRKTTQARAADGTFRPAGTRKKAIVEGKEKKR